MGNQLIIVGASGHGKVIADIARKNGYQEISFLDDDNAKRVCAGYKVIGALQDAERFRNSDFIVGIGSCAVRKRIQTQLEEKGLNIVSLIHPNAVIADSVTIGAGTVVMAGAIINPDTTIGRGCIVNTGATVDHDNRIADYVHISVGSHLAGTVTVGEGTMIGAGAVVSNNVRICNGCMIGAGAVVVSNLETAGTYVGVPARMLK